MTPFLGFGGHGLVIGVARVFRLGANVKLGLPTLCQKLKTHRIWSTIFWEGPKFTKKKNN